MRHHADTRILWARLPAPSCARPSAAPSPDDLHPLASLAAERGFTIVTFDRDFEPFPGVSVHLLGGGPGPAAG
jgi:predicted nucleic acid-binding protein